MSQILETCNINTGYLIQGQTNNAGFIHNFCDKIPGFFQDKIVFFKTIAYQKLATSGKNTSCVQWNPFTDKTLLADRSDILFLVKRIVHYFYLMIIPSNLQ